MSNRVIVIIFSVLFVYALIIPFVGRFMAGKHSPGYFRRLYMYSRVGAVTMNGFKRRLVKLGEGIHAGTYWPSERQTHFLASPELAEFLRAEVTYQWHLVTVKGQSRPFGHVMNLEEALGLLTDARPELEVIYIDHNNHFIFTRNLRSST